MTELLSPVGNKQMLEYAIHNGADAVYLSGIKYGARAYANNFTKEELQNAVKYSHLYGVSVYITVNTLIYESEIEEFIKYIDFLYTIGVDALIMQDIGMINLVRQKYPDLDIHASVQFHNHNESTIKLLESIGVKRVVLARELSLDKIKQMNISIEREIFVYGALCVCYSGCCLFSSLNGGRSGNRGECVGNCRLPYKLIKNQEYIETKNKYLLSMKDLNTLENLKELLDNNIESLKIEGRMKSPYYVGYVTKIYRRLIDTYYGKDNFKLNNTIITNLKKLYNRTFTQGYLFNDNNLTNPNTPNHIGVPCGTVINTTKKYIYIKLTEDKLTQEDGIRFKNSNLGMTINKLYNQKLNLTKEINKQDIAIIDNKFNNKIKKNEKVLKTIDTLLEKEISNYSKKKIKIKMHFIAKINKQIELIVTDDTGRTTTTLGPKPSKAINQDLSEEDIIKQLKKVGNTIYEIDKITIDKDDNIYINIKLLNEIRRTCLNKLNNIRENKYTRTPSPTLKEFTPPKNNTLKSNITLNTIVRNESQLISSLNNNIDNIYITDINLYNKYKNQKNIYYRIPRVEYDNLNFKNANLLITDYGSIYKYSKNNNLISDYYLNITNKESIKYLNSHLIKKVTLSCELSNKEISNIMKTKPNVEIIIYGRLELMITKYCILKNTLNYCPKCKNKKDSFYLEDKNHKKYPLERENCITHIMNHTQENKIKYIKDYLKMGIKNYRICFYDENYKECEKIIKKVKETLQNNPS